jgi:autotransporter-associated beta strand protein
VVVGSTISGIGSVVKLGNGTTTLAGTNTYSGGTTVNAGVLEVADNANLGAGSGAVTLNGGTLRTSAGFTAQRSVSVGTAGGTLDTGGNILVLQGGVTGSGNLTKTGTGQVTLAGTNTFTGTTTISQGAIQLNASSLAATNIAANGRLTGIGTIRGNLANAGNLSPGTSPGSITVNGNFSQAATGTLSIELASATSFDSVIVNGNATLDGTLAVSGLNSYIPAAGQTFPIIQATGTISGRFATLSSPWGNISPMLKFETLYAAKEVRLSMTQLPFAGVSGPLTQVAVGRGIDGAIAAGSIPNLQKALNALPNLDRVRAAMNELSPLRFERWYQQSVYNAGTMIRTASTRLDQAMREPRGSLWADVVGRATKFEAGTDGFAGDGTASGINVGADTRVTPDFHLGMLFGYTGENLRLDDAGSTTEAKRFSAALFARYDPTPWYVETVVGATMADLDSRRLVTIPGIAGVATSETDSQDQYASLRLGYSLAWNRMKLTPYAAADWVRWSSDPTTETGVGDANLRIRELRSESLASRAGITVAFPYLDESISFVPRIDLSWRHEFRDTRPAIWAEIGGSPFLVQGGVPVTDTALPIGLGAGANTDAEKSDGLVAGIGVDVTFGAWMTAYLRISTEWSTVAKRAIEARAGTELRF